MDTTNLVQKRFRELATRAQEAGARIASQVKEQQSKFGSRSIVAGEIGIDFDHIVSVRSNDFTLNSG